MRRFFEPASAPSWLKPVLSSIRAGLGDIWDVPVRPAQFVNVDLPPAADFQGGLVFDLTTGRFTGSDGSAWAGFQPYDATLAALAAYNTNGIVCQTAADTFAGRTLQAPEAGITITNPGGVAGNPTFALANDLAALEGLSGTNTIYYRSAADSWTAVTIGGNLGFSGGTLGSSLGTMAIQAGNNVAITGGTAALNGLSTNEDQSQIVVIGRYSPGLPNSYIDASANSSSLTLRPANGRTGFEVSNTQTRMLSTGGGTVFSQVDAGVDIAGLLQCDSFRIDAAPTAAAVAQTHHVPININGTTYKLLLAS